MIRNKIFTKALLCIRLCKILILRKKKGNWKKTWRKKNGFDISRGRSEWRTCRDWSVTIDNAVTKSRQNLASSPRFLLVCQRAEALPRWIVLGFTEARVYFVVWVYLDSARSRTAGKSLWQLGRRTITGCCLRRILFSVVASSRTLSPRILWRR